MRRFLLLFTLIVFGAMSCAGQNKWTKPDFHQDQFAKDHANCTQTVKDDPSEKITVEECLVQKGYEPTSSAAQKGDPRPSLLELVLMLPLIVLSGGRALVWGL